MLEQHAANVHRMAGDDWKKAERVKMSAWIQPKQDFRRFVNSLLQLNVAIVMAFRAKEKIKPVSGGQPQEQGWMPIISDELPYEMTINVLLEPGCDGVPTWQPEHAASRGMVKLPQQFRERFMGKKVALDEDDGEYLARWAAGDAPRSAEHDGDPESYRLPANYPKHGGKEIRDFSNEQLAWFINAKVPDAMKSAAKRALAGRLESEAESASSDEGEFGDNGAEADANA
jgi:hypothetical protein